MSSQLSGLRITVDVGGTFSDVALTNGEGELWIAKAPTTKTRGSTAIFEALAVIGEDLGEPVEAILGATELFVYSTTRATNAIIERRTAPTALLTTKGFPDILVRREGGRANAFDYTTPFPEPYIPRGLTFEVSERIDAEGGVVTPIDEADVLRIIDRLRTAKVEAVAVCLLWSVVNPAHELAIAQLLGVHLPDVAVTLSHQLWPALREYRRASATAIDASLKPVMADHLQAIGRDLADRGFRGELLAATSFGGVMHLDELSRRPIYSVKSGPALAPIAGRAYAAAMASALGEPVPADIVVCDTGGTSFDVSLVRGGEVVLTSETWLGGRFVGDLLPTSSVDARSIGAGGGSIAHVDAGGLLHVGPESAGADPGPACYGRGGTRPTVTDAAAVLGYLDPAYFSGGRLELDLPAARRALQQMGDQMDQTPEEAACSLLTVANEHMVGAIRDITVHEGLDPRDCLLVAGGGAAGLTIGEIAREVGAARALIPGAAGTLSAVGGQYSSVVAEFRTPLGVTSTDQFDLDVVRSALEELRAMGHAFAGDLKRRGIEDVRLEYFADARYAFQVWTIELPVDLEAIGRTGDHREMSESFDKLHARLFAVAEPGQTVEVLGWRVRVVADIGRTDGLRRTVVGDGSGRLEPKKMYFAGLGWAEADRHHAGQLAGGERILGPALILDPTTTVVVYPGAEVLVTEAGDFVMEVGG